MKNVLNGEIKITFHGKVKSPWNTEKPMASVNQYIITIYNKKSGAEYTFNFYQGLGIKKEPDIYTILGNFKTDWRVYIFEDFCGELGYNSDSIKDFKTWQSCQEESKNLAYVFPEFYDSEFEELQDY